MQEKSERVGELLRTLSNPKRLLILCQLVDGEQSVGALAQAIGARDSAVSQQLMLLRKEGLVSGRRDGQTIHYRLGRADVRALVSFLYATYCQEDQA
jgi:ArsR family transcriptional regulator, virulence genes transcriptional regulator